MESNISSRSSSPEPVAKANVGKGSDALEKKKRPVSDKQREALKLGMAKLKEKREQLAREKEDRKKTNEELKAKGLPPIEPPLKIKKQDIMELPKLEPVELKIKERKQRSDKGTTRASGIREKTNAIEELKKMVLEMKEKQEGRVIEKPVEVIKQVPVEVVKEKVVEREKVLTGSDLLNKIFFSK